MPLSSRNFVVSAVPFLATDRGDSELRIVRRNENSDIVMPLLVFSSSFLHGSFCPELITGEYSLCDSAEWVPGITSFCFENSSTVQFINSAKIHPQFVASLSQLITQSRYVTRQLVELHQVTDVSATLNAPLRNLNALRKLTLTFDPLSSVRSVGGEVPPDVDNLFDVHLARLHNLEELKILSSRWERLVIPHFMLARIWAMNPMRYLTNFEIVFEDDSAEIDLSVISEAHPSLQKLHVMVTKCRRDDDITTVILPTLAVMSDLRELTLLIDVQARIAWDELSDDDDDDDGNGDANPKNDYTNKSQEGMAINSKTKKYYCPHLTKLVFKLYNGSSTTREEMVKYFIEKLDGSRVADARLSHFGGGFLDYPFAHADRDVRNTAVMEVLTAKFPQLASIRYDGDNTIDFLKSVGRNLKEGSLTEYFSIDFSFRDIDADNGFAYLFDPLKATGGCYKSLTSLHATFFSKVLVNRWFGESLYRNEAFLQKQFVLRNLQLDGNTTFCVERFNEVLLAFSHCLEELGVPYQFLPEEFVPSSELSLRKMVRLHSLTCQASREIITATTLGRLVGLCPNLRTLAGRAFTDEHIEEFCDNFVESESKTIELEIKALPTKMLQRSWDRLAQLSSLREIRDGNLFKVPPLPAHEDEDDDEEIGNTDDEGKINVRFLLSKFHRQRPDVRIVGFERYFRRR